MRYKVGVQYIGTRYSGFALNQASRQPSVMAAVDQALQRFCGDKAIYCNFLPSSRTDAGVHALRNVCQFDIRKAAADSTPYDPEVVKKGLNYYLQSKKSLVHITDVSAVPDTFSARGEARARTYMYRILNHAANARSSRKPHSEFMLSSSCWSLFHEDRAWIIDQPLDLPAMVKASQHLLGEQDFMSLRNAGCQSKSTMRNVHSVQWFVNKQLLTADGIVAGPAMECAPGHPEYLSLLEKGVDEIAMVITADAYLLRMVRNIVGLLTNIGRGRLQPDDLRAILDQKSRTNVKFLPAPAQGLYLVDVHY